MGQDDEAGRRLGRRDGRQRMQDVVKMPVRAMKR